ncbi:MAG TPA: DUF1553 domain-containing protein, partial [Pirellulales bacterium]|nr:DUF1553 domain-containing protein [Pirellulales bacterium]
FATWLADAKSAAPKWLIVEAESVKSDGGAKLIRQEDGSYLATDKNPSQDVYTFVVRTKQKRLTAVRLDVLSDPSLPGGGPGRADNGSFALSDFQLWAAAPGVKSPGAPLKLVTPKATFEQPGAPIAASIDDNKSTSWGVDPQFGKDQSASFEVETQVKSEPGMTLTFILKFEGQPHHNLGRLRLSISGADKPVALDGEQAPENQVEDVNQSLLTPPADRTARQQAALAAWYRAHDADWRELSRAVQDHLRRAPKPELTKVMVTTEGLPAIRLHTQGADFFDQTFFLKRGDLNQKVAPAEQGFLQVLMTSPQGETHWKSPPPQGWRTSYRRRALANWITDQQQGAGNLLARVIVNRLWQHHLGRGIVDTPSDFGGSGSKPTHPELLDYLAGRLIAGQWRLKPLHKLILTSAVYIQGAAIDTPRAAVDPENKLLWHFNRRRLEAETIRDAILATAGRLDETMFGPGTLDPAQRRRSIYYTVKRSQLVPSMMLFDAPDALGGLGQRAATVVAPQALAMLNNPQIQESARAFAGRLAARDDAAEARIRRGYLMALAREPDAEELSAARSFIEAQTGSYQAAGKTDAHATALTDFCQVLFSLSEFIYID